MEKRGLQAFISIFFDVREYSILIQPMRFFTLHTGYQRLDTERNNGANCNRETCKFNESLNMHYSNARKNIFSAHLKFHLGLLTIKGTNLKSTQYYR